MPTATDAAAPAVAPAAAKRVRSWRRSNGAGWTLAAPAVLLLGVFAVVPVVLALTLGFTNARLISPEPARNVGMENFARLLGVATLEVKAERNDDGSIMRYEGEIEWQSIRTYTKSTSEYPQYRGKSELWSFNVDEEAGTKTVLLAGDPIFWKSLRNTLYFTLVVVPVQGGLGLLLAMLVNSKLRGRNFFRTAYFIPTLTSIVVVSMLWLFMYQPDGLINQGLSSVIPGYQAIDWLNDPKWSMPAIILLSVWQAVGFHMIIWLGGLQTIPGELYEAAKMDGAGAWNQFRYVTIPGLRHTFVFVFITITIAALGLFAQINVMTQGGPLDSTTTIVFQAVQQGYGKQQVGYGAAISFVFFVLVLVIALMQRFLTRKIDV